MNELKSHINCPLIGEEDVAVLLMTGCNVLDKIPKSVVNEIINMPFRIKNYPLIVERTKKCFGGVIGLKSLRENKITESPINEEKIVGGIIMSNNDKSKKIVDSSIAKVFTNDKLLGSPLYYLIGIYEII